MSDDSNFDDRLAESATRRAHFLDLFGFMPLSVLHLKRGALSRRMFHLPRERTMGSARVSRDLADTLGGKQKKSMEDRVARGIIVGGGAGTLHSLGKSGTLKVSVSIMAPELPEFVLKYYSTPHHDPPLTYGDPFAGQGVQMQCAFYLGFNYAGMDASNDYVQYSHALIPRLQADSSDVHLSVTHGDSRFPGDAIPDESCDVGFTSPPYWDIEYYGDEAYQLGVEHHGDYDGFMRSMRDVYAAWLPKFKQGAFFAVNVNDIRRDGRFIAYHADTMRALEDAGWIVHDLWIIEGLVAGMPKVFAAQHNERMVAPKVHEYLIIARRP